MWDITVKVFVVSNYTSQVFLMKFKMKIWITVAAQWPTQQLTGVNSHGRLWIKEHNRPITADKTKKPAFPPQIWCHLFSWHIQSRSLSLSVYACVCIFPDPSSLFLSLGSPVWCLRHFSIHGHVDMSVWSVDSSSWPLFNILLQVRLLTSPPEPLTPLLWLGFYWNLSPLKAHTHTLHSLKFNNDYLHLI